MATLKEIAALSGDSIRTVARVVHAKGYVKESTRARILEVIRAHGYEPDLAARSLKTGRNQEIAALVPGSDELHIAKIIAAEAVLREAGFPLRLFFASSGAEEEALRPAIERMKPSGLLLFPGVERTVDWGKGDLPCLTLDVRLAAHPGVSIDRAQGVEDAIRFLVSKGRRRIAYVGPPAPQSRTRLDGYGRALREAGLEGTHVETSGKEDFEALRALGRELGRSPRRFEAIQAFSDVVALHLLAGLHDAGARVPEDVALVGFDDRSVAALSWPRLTTIAQPNREVGERAAKDLLEWIGTGRPPEPSSPIPTRLVLRESA